MRLVSTENECRRQIISSAYLTTSGARDNHLCCDICAKNCNCGNQHATHLLYEWKDVPEEEYPLTREVTAEDKLIL